MLDHEALDLLGKRAEKAVSRLWVVPRNIVDPELLAGASARLLAAHVRAAQARGRAYGRIYLAKPSSGRFVVPPPPTKVRYVPIPSPTWGERDATALKGGGAGRLEEDPSRRLQGAFTTIIADHQPSTELQRVSRLAYDEPIQAAQAGYQAEIAESGTFAGYRRGINPDACQVCFWVWKEGYVYPMSRPMWRHTGCRCVPVPTTDRVGAHDLSSTEQTMLDNFMDRYQSN